MSEVRQFLESLLASRLTAHAASEFQAHIAEVRAGVSNTRFGALLSRASRFAPRAALAPDDMQRARAGALLTGWTPERWRTLEAWRVALILARPDLAEPSGVDALEEAFHYADEGEARALYKALALLPAPERFTARAAEGCRTNIVPVFEAVACDSPFAFRHFDDLAWRQLALKAVFIGAPLWRVYGLDDRLSPELARMALDLVDERRSAGRDVQHELWLCLGHHGGERGLASIARELGCARPLSRRAAALAAGRARAMDLLEGALGSERDEAVRVTMQSVLSGHFAQDQFHHLETHAA